MLLSAADRSTGSAIEERNADYDLGERRGLDSTAVTFHPHALADRYSKERAKAGRYRELIAFAERYFRDYGEPSNGIGPKRRSKSARRKRAATTRTLSSTFVLSHFVCAIQFLSHVIGDLLKFRAKLGHLIGMVFHDFRAICCSNIFE